MQPGHNNRPRIEQKEIRGVRNTYSMSLTNHLRVHSFSETKNITKFIAEFTDSNFRQLSQVGFKDQQKLIIPVDTIKPLFELLDQNDRRKGNNYLIIQRTASKRRHIPHFGPIPELHREFQRLMRDKTYGLWNIPIIKQDKEMRSSGRKILLT